jgi:hypothetical protein
MELKFDSMCSLETFVRSYLKDRLQFIFDTDTLKEQYDKAIEKEAGRNNNKNDNKSSNLRY